MISRQAEDDMLRMQQSSQEIKIMQQAIDLAEEVVQEAEEERQVLENKSGNSIALASLQRTVKSFERRTGVIYRNVSLESLTENGNVTGGVGIAMEAVIDYIKKLIRALIDSLKSVWERVKAFFRNVFSGAEKLRKRAEKLKEVSDAPSSDNYRENSTITNGEYIPSTILETAIKEKTAVSIRNVLIMELNALIVDSDTLRAGLQYALNKKPEVAEEYKEVAWSRGMNNDKSQWDKDYYMVQEVYLGHIFSKERYLHMIEVREYLQKKGVKGFARPESARHNEETVKGVSNKKINTPSVLEFATINGKATEPEDFVTEYSKQSANNELYRKALIKNIKEVSSGSYAKVLDAAKKPENHEEVLKLIKENSDILDVSKMTVVDNKDGTVTYSSRGNIHFLGDYYSEYTTLAKGATWEQILNGYSKIGFDFSQDKDKKEIKEISALTKEQINSLATTIVLTMEKYKEMENEQKKLDAGFNKLLAEARRLENEKDAPRQQLMVASGFVRATINAVMKTMVSINSYELRLTKAALDYASASMNAGTAT